MVSDGEKIDLLARLFSSNQDTLKMADTKSSFILGISGILLSATIQIMKTNVSSYKIYCLDLAVICLLFAIISQIKTISPRMRENDSKGILFYKDILKCLPEEYAQNFKEVNYQKIIDDYLACIYELALIQQKKFMWLNRGILFFTISIMAICLSFFIDNLVTHF